MKKVYKMMLVALCAVLLVATSVMGTLAYLQMSTQTITNVMTVGKVEIELSEAKVNEYGELDGDNRITATATVAPTENNTYKLIPGHKYTKDPTITVKSGSEECWVFLKIEDGLGNASEIVFDSNWILIFVDGNSTVHAYSSKLNAGGSATLFSEFTFANTADPKDYEDSTINVTAYAVQSEGFTDGNGNGTAADEAWEATFGA